jgi:hypothetical protein
MDLDRIVNVLPLTTATSAEKRAWRIHSPRRGLDEMGQLSDGIILLLKKIPYLARLIG